MKKVFYATLALGALILASCQKENSVNGPKVESLVFTAYIDTDAPAGQHETKTVLDGKTSLWNQDHIWILNGDPKNNGWKKEYQTDATSSSTATFTESNSEVSLGEGPVVAICPKYAGDYAWWNAAEDKTVNKLWLKPVQSPVESGYDPDAHVAVAYSETRELSFSNAVSLLKFTCGSADIKEVCVYANGDKASGKNILSGNFSFNADPDNKNVITGSDVINKYVKLSGNFVNGKTYYLACLPTTFTNGFTVAVYSNGNKGQVKTTEKSYTLLRNKILDLGTIVYEEVTGMKTVYLYPGPWTDAGAVLSVYYWRTGGDGWVDFSDADGDGRYEAEIPQDINGYKFVRSNPEQPLHDFRYAWDQSGDVNISESNCLTVDGKWNKALSNILK